jgi:hypothetical protein
MNVGAVVVPSQVVGEEIKWYCSQNVVQGITPPETHPLLGPLGCELGVGVGVVVLVGVGDGESIGVLVGVGVGVGVGLCVGRGELSVGH